MPTYRDVREFWARKAPWLIQSIGVWSSNGTTAYGVDAAKWQDTTSVGLDGQSLNNIYIFQPDVTTTSDRERSIGGNSGQGLDPTNGRIYPKVAWANAPQAGARYELHAVPPTDLFNDFVDSLSDLFYQCLRPVPIFPDADMQASGVGNWTSNGTITKDLTPANTFSSPQSLKFQGDQGDYFRSQNIVVTPQSYYEAWMVSRNESGSTGFAIWDMTNNVELDPDNRTVARFPRFSVSRRQITVPQDCYEIAVGGIAEENGTVAYISSFSGPRKNTDSILPAPSGLKYDRELRKLFVATYEHSLDNNVWDAYSRRFIEVDRKRFYAEVNPFDATATQIVLRRGSVLPVGDIWIEQLRRVGSALALDNDYTSELVEIPLPLELIGWKSLKNICENILRYSPTDTDVNRTMADIERQGSDYRSVMSNYADTLESPQYRSEYPRWSFNSL